MLCAIADRIGDSMSPCALLYMPTCMLSCTGHVGHDRPPANPNTCSPLHLLPSPPCSHFPNRVLHSFVRPAVCWSHFSASQPCTPTGNGFATRNLGGGGRQVPAPKPNVGSPSQGATLPRMGNARETSSPKKRLYNQASVPFKVGPLHYNGRGPTLPTECAKYNSTL